VDSPRRIFGRKNCFCSSDPYCMMVGATELTVSIGRARPPASTRRRRCTARSASCRGRRNSFGQPMPSRFVAAHLQDDLADPGADALGAPDLDAEPRGRSFE
jgi:hypothetical protein